MSKVIDSIPYPFMVINVADRTVTLANEVARREGDDRPTTCHALRHQRTTPCGGRDYPCPLEIVTRTKQPTVVTHTHTDAEGRSRRFEIHGHPIIDDGGDVVQIVEYSIDVTDRLHAEEALRRRNRELVVLNWVNGAAASGLPPDQVLSEACRQLTEALGFDFAVAGLLTDVRDRARIVAEWVPQRRGGFVGQTIPFGPDETFSEAMRDRNPIATDHAPTDPRLGSVAGEIERLGIRSLLAAPLVVEHELEGFLALASTDPRETTPDDVGIALSVAGQAATCLARHRMDAARRRLESAIQDVDDAVVNIDGLGIVRTANRAFSKLAGSTPSRIVGRHIHELVQAGLPAEVGSILSPCRVKVRDRTRCTIANAGSAPTVLEASVTLVRGDRDGSNEVVAVIRDVTREAELEQKTLQSQKMESVGRLAGGVAHDFNNLLGAILGMAEIGLQTIPSDSPAAELLEEIVATTDHAAGVARQLLLFARRESSDPEVVELNHVIDGLQAIVSRLIGEDIAVTMELAADRLPVLLDPARFEQVMLNLAINSRDAMPRGGQLTISTRAVNLDATECSGLGEISPGAYAVLEVTDTGVGMSDETAANAFEPFFTTKAEAGGTGLGLSTCFGVVGQAGGHIEIDSAMGSGCTVRILLPITNRATESSAHASDQLPPSGGTEHVLVVEDETINRNLMARALEGFGYRVTVASDGAEALELLENASEPFDVVVSDVVMPRIGGAELVAGMRARGFGTPIVFMSGYPASDGLPEDTRHTMLAKPFHFRDLARAVRAAID